MDKYKFLKWVIHKYKKELPYSSLPMFVKSLGYSSYPRWARHGVPRFVVTILEKDLLIAKLTNKIDINEKISIKELENKFKNIKM